MISSSVICARRRWRLRRDEGRAVTYLRGPRLQPTGVTAQAHPSCLNAMPEFHTFVMWLILSPSNCIT